MFNKLNSYIKILLNKSLVISFKVLFSNKYLILHAASDSKTPNFGDDLNFYVLSKLTKKKIVLRSKIFNFINKPTYTFIGSILDNLKFNNLYILGSGFISEHSSFYSINPKVYFVRGPRSLKILNQFSSRKINADFGDASLLVKRFYNPSVIKKYCVGVIPHYIDLPENSFKLFYSRIQKQTQTILIESSFTIEKYISTLKSCDIIVSSSLHGIIMADLYGIPSLWVEFSNKVIGSGFKFFDYFESTGDYLTKPIQFDSNLDDLDYEFIKLNAKKRDISSLELNLYNLIPKKL